MKTIFRWGHSEIVDSELIAAAVAMNRESAVLLNDIVNYPKNVTGLVFFLRLADVFPFRQYHLSEEGENK